MFYLVNQHDYYRSSRHESTGMNYFTPLDGGWHSAAIFFKEILSDFMDEYRDILELHEVEENERRIKETLRILDGDTIVNLLTPGIALARFSIELFKPDYFTVKPMASDDDTYVDVPNDSEADIFATYWRDHEGMEHSLQDFRTRTAAEHFIAELQEKVKQS